MKNPPAQLHKGFTLIELLVAMAITTIIITILVSVTGLSLDAWNRTRSEVRASRQGTAMIDSMTRDLEAMVIRRGNDFEWLYAESNPSTSGPNGHASPNAADLVFFSAVTDRYNGDVGVANVDNGGDVSTVAYKLEFKDPIGGSNDEKFQTFVLYRKLINPDVTFTDTLGKPFSAGGTALLTAAQTAAADPSMSSNAIDDEGNFICENVYQFSLTFHVEVTQPNGTLTTVPVPLGGSTNTTEIFKVIGNGLHMDNQHNR